MAAADPRPAAGETLDRLAGDWRIFQLARGHRWATDDALVAWTATRARPDALRLLDLGSGVGSVGLLALLHAPPDAYLTSIEVLDASVALQRKTVAYNRLEERVDVRLGDLRYSEVLGDTDGFDIITANPPYLPERAARRSPNQHRAAARLELHGDVFDYCRAAGRWLAPSGRFCFCHSSADARPERAVAAAGLALLCRQEVVFRAGKPPTIALFTCGWNGERCDLPPITVRTREGERTGEYRAVRRALRIEA
jgi:tRNA1(Val) A37 N6-methylase TrmN6